MFVGSGSGDAEKQVGGSANNRGFEMDEQQLNNSRVPLTASAAATAGSAAVTPRAKKPQPDVVNSDNSFRFNQQQQRQSPLRHIQPSPIRPQIPVTGGGMSSPVGQGLNLDPGGMYMSGRLFRLFLLLSTYFSKINGNHAFSKALNFS